MAFQAWKLQPMNQPCDTVYWQRVLSNYPYSSGVCQPTSDLSSHTQRLQAVGLEQVSWVYLKVVLIHGKILVGHCTCNHFVPCSNTSIFQTFFLIDKRKDSGFVSVHLNIEHYYWFIRFTSLLGSHSLKWILKAVQPAHAHTHTM